MTPDCTGSVPMYQALAYESMAFWPGSLLKNTTGTSLPWALSMTVAPAAGSTRLMASAFTPLASRMSTWSFCIDWLFCESFISSFRSDCLAAMPSSDLRMVDMKLSSYL